MKEKVSDEIIGLGSSTAGAVVGAGVGMMVAGLPGAAGGAVLGEIVKKVLETVGKDVKNRLLSKSEEIRIGSALSKAQEKIQLNLSAGKSLRSDAFFEKDVNDRSVAEEILEGTLLAAQRAYEEKKIPYLSNLYANIAFDESVSRPMANQLIKTAEELTYQQYIILRVIGLMQPFRQNGLPDPRLTQPFNSISGMKNVTIASDIYNLYQKSLVFSKDVLLGSANITPSNLELAGYGAMLFNLMELRAMEVDDNTGDIIMFLTGAKKSQVV